MIIYKITNEINGKCYVGQTKLTIRERWYGHCSKNGCTAMHNAIVKYGRENFTIEQIDSATSEDELNQKEAYWIEKLNTLCPNGYNLRTGGDRFELSEKSKERVSKSIKALWDAGEYEATWTRKVCQYSKRGKLIKVWDSIREAANALGISDKHIPSVCSKERISTGGYVWRYYDDEHSPTITIQKRRSLPKTWRDSHRKPIRQLTLDGELIKEWDSTLEASTTLGFSNGYLCDALKGKHEKAYGFRWEYAEQEVG